VVECRALEDSEEEEVAKIIKHNNTRLFTRHRFPLSNDGVVVLSHGAHSGEDHMARDDDDNDDGKLQIWSDHMR